MASLMENLIEILNSQCEAYEKLVELSDKKTGTIVAGDIENLQRITDEEQAAVVEVNILEKKREEVMKDIANVINKNYDTLKLSDLVKMIEGRPEEHDKLETARVNLLSVGKRLRTVNERNKELLENALEMVDFDLSLIQAMKQAPQMGNYNRGALNTGEVYGTNLKGFDTKQ